MKPVVNAHMGNSDLIPDHYFRFPRQSGIPHGYFSDRKRWHNLGVLFTLLALLLVACSI